MLVTVLKVYFGQISMMIQLLNKLGENGSYLPWDLGIPFSIFYIIFFSTGILILTIHGGTHAPLHSRS